MIEPVIPPHIEYKIMPGNLIRLRVEEDNPLLVKTSTSIYITLRKDTQNIVGHLNLKGGFPREKLDTAFGGTKNYSHLDPPLLYLGYKPFYSHRVQFFLWDTKVYWMRTHDAPLEVVFEPVFPTAP